jgi:hypothetical protein
MIMDYEFEPLDFSRSRTFPIGERVNKVRVGDFARVVHRGAPVTEWIEALPDILAGRDFRALVHHLERAIAARRVILFSLGAHVIKCGLAPWLIALMERRYVSGLALNGAGAIHDSEIALIGGTSEDVAAGIRDGNFGMWTETGALIEKACALALREGMGMGRALGKILVDERAPFLQYSILARGYELGIPVTVHVAFGGDIFHTHGCTDGGSLGAATFNDFRLICGIVARVGEGSVIINFGSAVVLPTVIEKAITVARNQGFPVEKFTGASFDFIRNYRSMLNPVQRAKDLGGTGLTITGHHELMIPLLCAALLKES